MTQAIAASENRGNTGLSIAAVLAGFFAVAAASLGTDQVFHLLKVYPPWGEPMRSPGAMRFLMSAQFSAPSSPYIGRMRQPENVASVAIS
jgi:hypothetical protein